MVAPLRAWPWENLGALKYLLYGPLVAKVLYSRLYDGGQTDGWCLHILTICVLRCFMYQIWFSYSNMLFLTRHHRVLKQSVDFKQIDREWDWDNFIILQALISAMACYSFQFLMNLPLWNLKGCIYVLVLHIGVSEPLYYFIHRRLHTVDYLFKNYHSLHHSSVLLQPFTAGCATLLEHLILSVIMGIPIVVGVVFMGSGSTIMIYGYVLIFDFLRSMGHSNVEIFPHGIFEAFPTLRFLLYTPTYHSLHHTEMGTNFCLFMPLFDVLGKTLNEKSWKLQKQISTGLKDKAPDFVFLAHVVDFQAALHVPFVLRSYSSHPFSINLLLLPCWPITILVMLVMWACSKTFLISSYTLRTKLAQTWAVPRFGFQYFLPFARDGINCQIEQAILRADKLGVKVLSLAALNKNETLNGGGTLFVNKHPELSIRIVHGNTLTAAVIVKEIPKDVKEVFLTGATSKLGRAIALYLCRSRIRVLMFTQSSERFQAIQKAAPVEFQNYLVQVTKYQAAQKCKTWIVGKWITPREQRWAPRGTHFHQFVVPCIISFRRDCTYGKLAAMRLPKDIEGLGTCEYTMERGVVHACHAGGVVHLLEGWTHHEVGHIDIDTIDLVWEAALRHGFKPVARF